MTRAQSLVVITTAGLQLGTKPGRSLADIGNLRKLERVIKDGLLIDPDSLPTNPRMYRRR